MFWDHFAEMGPRVRRRIVELMDARRAAGVVASSPIKIHCADATMGYVATIGDQLAVHLGSADGSRAGPPRTRSGEPWEVVVSGEGYTVWLCGAAVAALGATRASRAESGMGL